MTARRARKTNRDTERRYFEQFRKVYALPPGEVGYADKPDVFIKGPRTVGIEITNFYLEPGNEEGSEQRQRPRRSEVASEADGLYLAAGGKGIELTIEFNPAKPITSASRKILPQKIAAFAGQRRHATERPFLS